MRSHSSGSHSGINASLKSYDSWEAHVQDTLKAGEYLNNQDAVEILCKEARTEIGIEPSADHFNTGQDISFQFSPVREADPTSCTKVMIGTASLGPSIHTSTGRAITPLPNPARPATVNASREMPAKIAIVTGSGIIYFLNRIGIKSGPCSCPCYPRYGGRKRTYLTRRAVHDFRRSAGADRYGAGG